MDNLRYPIGKHDVMAPIDETALAAAIATLRELPSRLEPAVGSLDDSQLDTPYRPEGWTVRQVVHHLADSHLNAHTRLRLALTEDAPVIRPYREAAWAELADAKSLPLEPSLAILRGLHARWSTLLSALGPAEFARPWIHPDRGQFSVAQLTGLYGWHSRHHLAHITSLIERSGWANSSARVAALAMMISTEDLAALGAMYAERSPSGHPTSWRVLVEELRRIRRVVEAGAVVQVEGVGSLATWQEFYAWAHGRYHMLEDGCDPWIGDDAS